MHYENMSSFLETHVFIAVVTTLPKTNIAPENRWLEDEFPFGVASWQVLCWFQGL